MLQGDVVTRVHGPTEAEVSGDVAPEGYIAWHEWAARQAKRGYVQQKCAICAKFKFPVELSARVIVSHPQDSRGRVHETTSPVCLKCDAARKETR